MSKELVISSNRHETKVAILEDDQLVEVFFQRANEYSLAGSIHKGRVTRVLPGMQSAFVDLGLERDTFLYVSDFFEETEDFDRVPVTREPSPVDRPAFVPEESQAAEPAEAEQPASPVSETLAYVAPAQERRDDREGRDQRGRRSRRRRNRGRGFPDSKYAAEPSRGPRPTEAPAARESISESRTPSTAATSFSAPPPASAAGSDFALLPGESLAKYRGGNIQPLDDAEEEEIRSLQATDEIVQAAPDPETAPELPEEPASLEAEEEPVNAGSASSAEDEIPAGVTALESEVETGHAVSEPAAEPSMLTGEEPAPEPGSEVAAASDQPSSSESATPQQSAQVREQGGRYGHRMPRRMRRKMRGESRPEMERRSDGGPAPAAEPAPSRPESSRTVSRTERPAGPSISELLKEGQEIIVQIAKEPLGQKGARITSHIALPGRYVVYMPTVEHTGVSRKIASDEERLRLKRILQIHHVGVAGGFIVRTAGEGRTEDEIAADMNFLANLWLDIRQKAEKKPAPLLLHHDLDIVQRTLRDQLTEHFKAIWVDNEELFESVVHFVQRFQPALASRVKLYTRAEPIFDAFNITAEMEKALRPKVWLKSGGYIVINQTEALVAIDVNTGKYVGRSNRLEDTIVKTNTEAVKEIVRQIRLRDLGGIIVVDFIDMDERKNRQKVMQTLEDAMRADRAPYKILQFNDFGLVAITRKRVKQSLERALCMPCPYCEGAGYVKSVATIVSEILQEAHKIASAVDGKDCMLRVHPDVAKFLKSNQNKYLEEIEEILRRPVLVKADPVLHHEKFDLA
jgi:ribonuclease G